MREIRSSGSVEGVVSNHDPYSDYLCPLATKNHREQQVRLSTSVNQDFRVDLSRHSVPPKRFHTIEKHLAFPGDRRDPAPCVRVYLSPSDALRTPKDFAQACYHSSLWPPS